VPERKISAGRGRHDGAIKFPLSGRFVKTCEGRRVKRIKEKEKQRVQTVSERLGATGQGGSVGGEGKSLKRKTAGILKAIGWKRGGV